MENENNVKLCKHESCTYRFEIEKFDIVQVRESCHLKQ